MSTSPPTSRNGQATRTDTEVPTPPVARVEPQVTEIHGVRLVDPYHWLRRRGDAEVQAYLEAENAYLEAVTAPTESLRATLFDELIGRIRETDTSAPVVDGGYAYYDRTERGLQYGLHCRRPVDASGTPVGDEEVLLDLNALADGRDYLKLGALSVSPDHRLLAYGLDDDGSEDFTLAFKDLARGTLLADTVPKVASSLAWANDNQTIFYTLRDAARRPYRVMRHELGSDPAEDVEVYRDDDERFYVSVYATRSRRFVVASSSSSLTSEVHLLDADRPTEAFRVFSPRRQGVEYDVDHQGEHLYVRTNEDAANFRLLRTPVDDWRPARWIEVRPHRPRVKLEWFEPFARHLVIAEREAGQRRLQALCVETGNEHTIETPESVYAINTYGNRTYDTATVTFAYTSMVTPRTVYTYDLETRTRRLLKQDDVRGGYRPERYETRRLFARARDGVAVPVTLLHRKGLVRDGTNPCLLYAYGAYGATLDPAFSPNRLSLVDRGFLYAIAHVRGGGALGESWHEDGRMGAKRNTFDDFVDVASFMIEQGYTASDRLVAQGGSAGGLLVGAVVNMRPELFRAAVAQVPFVDLINTMLDETMPLTVGEFEEWGNPKERAAFEYMRSYSPYDNVTAQAYPRLLITAGLNDPRVQYWEPAKWAAKLRATKTDDELLLLKTNMGAGHGGASGRYDAYRELAFLYAFVLDAVGAA